MPNVAVARTESTLSKMHTSDCALLEFVKLSLDETKYKT